MKFLFLILIILTTCAKSYASKALVKEACKRYHVVDCDVILAIAFVETRYRHLVTPEPDGTTTYGILQVKCETARKLGMKNGCEQLRKYPMIALRFGIKEYKHQLKRYNGNVREAVAAYNAGTAIRCKDYLTLKRGRIMCIRGEFINEYYVWQVSRIYDSLKMESGVYFSRTPN